MSTGKEEVLSHFIKVTARSRYGNTQTLSYVANADLSGCLQGTQDFKMPPSSVHDAFLRSGLGPADGPQHFSSMVFRRELLNEVCDVNLSRVANRGEPASLICAHSCR